MALRHHSRFYRYGTVSGTSPVYYHDILDKCVAQTASAKPFFFMVINESNVGQPRNSVVEEITSIVMVSYADWIEEKENEAV